MSEDFYNLFIPVKGLKDIINNSYVVVDTNVLLMAYQWRGDTFSKVLDALRNLSDQNRLCIPNQVVKEFANKRAELIQNLYQDINDKLLSALPERVSENRILIENVVPAFNIFPQDLTQPITTAEKEFVQVIKDYNKARSTYNDGLKDLQTIIKSFLDKDPILEQYEDIFRKCVMKELILDETFETELKDRKDNQIPPGYKDKGHRGDLIIWKEILGLKDKPVILVTRDNKPDWVYMRNNEVLGARRELVEEFYKENKETIKILSVPQFIDEYYRNQGSPVEEKVKDDLLRSTVKLESTPVNLDNDLSTDKERIRLGLSLVANIDQYLKNEFRSGNLNLGDYLQRNKDLNDLSEQYLAGLVTEMDLRIAAQYLFSEKSVDKLL